MGDTHYWTIKDGEKWTSVWNDVVGDIHRIVDYVNAHPESMGFHKGRKEPSVVVRFEEDYVMINDAVEAWAENVILERNRKRSDCCKSVYRSFNPVLQAVLLRMHHHMGDEGLGISSEVGWSWWQRGVGLEQKVFEVVEVPKPEGLRLLMAGESDDELDLLRST
ncbi:hypothetical protein EV715DRAFT_286618 [Schizophyllum commune]